MFTGWRICLEAIPTPSCHQGSTVVVPTSPAHMFQATCYSLLTFFPLSDASADHFNLILLQSQLCWVAGPLPAYSLGSYPLFPRNSPSFLWQRAWGGDEGGWGQSTRNVFNSNGSDICLWGPYRPGSVYPDRGPLRVLRGRFCQLRLDGRDGHRQEGIWQLPGWSE